LIKRDLVHAQSNAKQQINSRTQQIIITKGASKKACDNQLKHIKLK
jgi:hypothetical protein